MAVFDISTDHTRMIICGKYERKCESHLSSSFTTQNTYYLQCRQIVFSPFLIIKILHLLHGQYNLLYQFCSVSALFTDLNTSSPQIVTSELVMQSSLPVGNSELVCGLNDHYLSYKRNFSHTYWLMFHKFCNLAATNLKITPEVAPLLQEH